MVHEGHPELSERTWNKDTTVLKDARAIYETDEKKYLPMWASTLYSFRRRKECARELMELMPRLMKEVPRTVNAIAREGDRARAASLAETVGTHIAWAVPRFTDIEQHDVAQRSAEKLIAESLRLTEKEPLGGHTRVHALIVDARLKGTMTWHYNLYLQEAGARARYIVDEKQRRRAYRNLADGFRHGDAFLTAFGWGLRWTRLELARRLNISIPPKPLPQDEVK